MRTTTYPGGPVPTLKHKTVKSRVVPSPFVHKYQKPKMTTSLENKILEFYQKFLN
jgi:hypothetical protein